MTGDYDLLGLIIAALGGAAVGLEREWAGHTRGSDRRFAGIRTFTLLGGLGGLAGLLWINGLTWPAVILLLGPVAIVAAAYFVGSRTDLDSTTEVAALVVISAGFLAGTGGWQIASGIIAVTCLLLVEKSRLHGLVARIDDVGLRAGVHFAVMALVVLPLLPSGPFGPWGGIRPRELWALVLFFSGLSFVGYVARRIFDTRRGYLVAGALGGLISSTNVTFTFARLSRADTTAARGLAFGAVAANALLYPRVLIATAVLNFPLAAPLAPYLIVPFLIAAAVALIGLRSSKDTGESAPPPANPLQLGAALQMVVIFQVVLMLVHLARNQWGEVGLLSSAAVLGLTDVDALTATMARSVTRTSPLEVAALAIAVGVLSNTAMKMAIALFLGRSQFRTIAAGTLALMLLGGGAAMALLLMRS
ncbi:MAG TPA: MgtC/SapB family protein [Thermoanaerobaculia bacterium]|nr:MgtC/SapB family protein [Thermoanaerobaculia bacterium]